MGCNESCAPAAAALHHLPNFPLQMGTLCKILTVGTLRYFLCGYFWGVKGTCGLQLIMCFTICHTTFTCRWALSSTYGCSVVYCGYSVVCVGTFRYLVLLAGCNDSYGAAPILFQLSLAAPQVRRETNEVPFLVSSLQTSLNGQLNILRSLRKDL